MTRLQASRLALLTLGLFGMDTVSAAMRALVVSGIGGEPQYEERFAKWAEQVTLAATTATGDPARVAMVDDSPQNLVPGRARGWWTVWLRSPHSLAGGRAGGSMSMASDDGPHVTIDRLIDLRKVLAID